MELKVEYVKNIQSITVCKKIIRQSLSQNDKLNQELRHQKYKRCLAMAKWCNERWILDDCLYELGKTRFYERWENRWLKIAEQFKEAKCR